MEESEMSKATRSRGGIAAGAFLALCLSAASALAQGDRPVTTSKDMGDTIKVTVTGDVVLDYVYRSRELTGYTSSMSNPPPSAGTPTTSEPENSFEGHVAMRLGVELSEKVSGVVEFGTRRVDAGVLNRLTDGAAAESVQLREAHVLLGEFLTPALKAQLGITTWSFDVRGRGEAFAFDPRHAQSIRRNFDVVTDVNFQEAADARLPLAGAPDELFPVGATLMYSRDNWMLDIVLLPGVIEGGRSNADEALYAVDFWYNLDSMGKGSRFGLIAALSSFLTNPAGAGAQNEHARVWTVGAGGVLKFMDGALEVYAEGYFQTGKAGREAATDSDVDAKGRAFQVGLEYRHVLGNPMPIWFGANFTMITGDSDDQANDDEANRFGAYENVNDLLIIESMYFGFDWDSNYEAFKLSAGTAFSVAGGKDNLEVSVVVGITQAAEEVGDSATPFEEDKLGNEVDIKMRWHLSKQASLSVAAGFLFGSDILEQSMETTGGITTPNSNRQADDSAYLYMMGLSLKF
jgi:hypothetical protein